MRMVRIAVMTAGLMTIVQQADAAHFVVGVENIEYYPHYTVVNGEYGGFGRALLDAYAKDRGHTFEYQALPVVRLTRDFVDGKLDFKYPDNNYWGLDLKAGKSITYSDPVVDYIDGVNVLPAKKDIKVDEVKRLGMVFGFTPWEWMDRIKAGKVELEENPNFQGLLKQTLMGRNDGAYASVAVVNYQLENVLHQPGALVFAAGLPHSSSSYRFSSLTHADIIQDFNAWMKEKADMVAKLKADFAVEKGVH